MPNVEDEIMHEAHRAPYAMHPDNTKMYRDLSPYYWWPTMKKDVVEFMARCKSRTPSSSWKHDAIWVIVDRLTKSAYFLPIYQNDSLDKLAKLYVTEIFHSSIGMAPYEALYGSKCRSPICWDIEGLRQLEGPGLVQKTVDKIQTIKKCLKEAQDRQKSYVNKHHREMEYEVGEKVFLKVSPWRGILSSVSRKS
ncbi:UNVERIFIED_CONTAM: hypothetical protein Slati_0403400 [Sesamum latifolium]|uniref:Integrase zinc-binding domain-containing protein n=1 Tax=Sesamum latifolium TaxID=2727402 RepID=A0AAW2XUW7_9LAMI